MSGDLDSISFNNCFIGKFNAFSITSALQSIHSISIENTDIDSIDSQSLKRLHIENLVLRNTSFRSHLPSRTFNALKITNDFSISNCSFATISSHAIDLDGMPIWFFSCVFFSYFRNFRFLFIFLQLKMCFKLQM